MAASHSRIKEPARAGLLSACLIMAAGAGCSNVQSRDVGECMAHGPVRGVVPTSADPDLQAFLVQLQDATKVALGGDVSRWNELVSHSDEASLFPPFGGVFRGWDQTRTRYEAAAARMSAMAVDKADLDVEVLASGVSGDLAYVVAFERSRFLLADDTLESGFTRVTHIFRREQGQWRLVHRHMDHLPEEFTPPHP